MKNQIVPARDRRESPGAETLCGKSHTVGQHVEQVFGARGLEKQGITCLFFCRVGSTGP